MLRIKTSVAIFYNKDTFMHNAIPLSLAALMAVAIIVIGCFYLLSPERMTGSFGLKLPAPDADTRAWLRLKGIRDVVSGLVVPTMMLAADRRHPWPAFTNADGKMLYLGQSDHSWRGGKYR